MQSVPRRAAAVIAAFSLLLPLLIVPARPAHAQRARRGQGMSTRTKVLLLGGAALLYYLYRKHQAQARQAGTPATVQGTPQLYRSRNGGIYYRDPNGKPVWLTVPSQSVRVPAADVQRYAPDYSRYRGPAPRVPSGYRTQSFTQFDPNALVPAGPRR